MYAQDLNFLFKFENLIDGTIKEATLIFCADVDNIKIRSSLMYNKLEKLLNINSSALSVYDDNMHHILIDGTFTKHNTTVHKNKIIVNKINTHIEHTKLYDESIYEMKFYYNINEDITTTVKCDIKFEFKYKRFSEDTPQTMQFDLSVGKMITIKYTTKVKDLITDYIENYLEEDDILTIINTLRQYDMLDAFEKRYQEIYDIKIIKENINDLNKIRITDNLLPGIIDDPDNLYVYNYNKNYEVNTIPIPSMIINISIIL